MSRSLQALALFFLLSWGIWGAAPSELMAATPPPVSYPYDTRSDSIDILNYAIRLQITDFAGTSISGSTRIHFSPLVNGVSAIRLDLMSLAVDSVVWDASGNSIGFTQAAQLVHIPFPAVQNDADTTAFTVYYHGVPSHDPSFGGFYFQSGFAYNVGVSLSDIPHNYGRTWFPCFDNFTERSTYDLVITTQDTHTAICGGLLTGQVDNGNGTKTYTWRVNQTIPSYLISVAVNNLALVQDSYSTIAGGNIPVMLAARPSDTAAMHSSFTNLPQAFGIFENRYGPYRWDRVGYVLVPMTGGAMEHAMNIAFPILLAGGSTTYQDIMAHELSHHWWGNLVTCRTAEDMWINEGSAVYCEYIFNEDLYGPASYRTLVRDAHRQLLHKAHIDDAGYWPLSGMPQAHTYSTTTYQKGADILHTLRSYLGDTVYFNGMKQLLTQNAFSDIDADEYRDDLSAITGMNLDNFFDDWIFQGGWPHFSIDSLDVSLGNVNNAITLYSKQKLTGRSNYSHQVPMTISLFDTAWQRQDIQVMLDGPADTLVVYLPIYPTYAVMNLDEKISHAITAETRTIKTTGSIGLPHAQFSMNVTALTDSVFFVVEHNWTAPDPLIDWTKGYTLSPQRYWRIGGLWNSGFNATATLNYNGRTTGTSGHLDHLLINTTEDSLVLLYRPGPGYDWNEYTSYTVNTGSNHNDKMGNITVNNLQQGEYTLALKGQSIGLDEQANQFFKVYPNPASQVWNLSFGKPLSDPALQLYDARGRLCGSWKITLEQSFQLDAHPYGPGIYFLCLYDHGRLLGTHKIVKQ